MGCSDCGSEIDRAPSAGAVGMIGHRPGLAVESPADVDGPRRVEYNPSSGGRSVSETDAAGSFNVNLAGPLQVGRAGEPHVITTLINALRESGKTAHQLTEHSDRVRDDRGEDGLIEINGCRFIVQVETVPRDEAVWHEWSRGCASRAGGPGEAVELVRAAIEHKASHLAPDARQSTLLALDASNFGALASRPLVEEYLAKYGDPEVEFNFPQTWIVGPTKASTVRIVASTKSPAV